MTDRDLLESLSNQMGELVRNVAEVRKSNHRLEAEMVVVKTDIATMKGDITVMKDDINVMKGDITAMKGDIQELQCGLKQTNEKIDERTEFLSTKIDHFVKCVSAEIMKNRIAIEEQNHAGNAVQRRIESRVDAIESRLDRLESAGGVVRE